MKFRTYTALIFLTAAFTFLVYTFVTEPAVRTPARSRVDVPASPPPTWGIQANLGGLPTVTVRIEPINVRRTILFFGEVTGESVDKAISSIYALESLSNEPIYLLLDSPGGSILDGERLISVMETSNAPVRTVCMEMCASMAAVIHQYGSERLATDRSILMFHDGSGSFSGPFKKIRGLLNLIEFKLERTDRYIAAKSHLSYEAFMEMQKYDLWIDTSAATRYHLVDSLIRIKFVGVSLTSPNLQEWLKDRPKLNEMINAK